MPVSSSDGKPVQFEPWAYGVDWEVERRADGWTDAVAYNGPNVIGNVSGKGPWFELRLRFANWRLMRRYGPLRRGAR